MGRKKVKTAPHKELEEGASATSTEVAASSAKTRHIRGKRGGLKNMPTMPLDILLEIFSHLHPRDLLNLARTNKSFRAFLMSRTSAHLWKASRQHIEGFPDCPPHLSEPEYANLAFFPYCHKCFKPNIQAVIWEWCVRYCNTCKEAMSAPYFCFRLPAGILAYTNLSPVAMLNAMINTGRRFRDLEVYHLRDIQEINETFEKLGEVPAWKEFVEAKAARAEEIRQHSALCEMWQARKAASRATELENVRKIRLEAIVNKLRKIGWGEELDLLPASFEPLSRNVHVRMSKELTDRAWLKIRDDVVVVMEGIKARRLIDERRVILTGRLTAFASAVSDFYSKTRRTADSEFDPVFADLVLMPDVRRVLDVPNKTDIGLETLDKLRSQLPTLIEQWKMDVRTQLRQLLRDHIPETKGVDPLDLAMSYFECNSCRKVLRYPDVVAHQCLRRHPKLFRSGLSLDTIYEFVACMQGTIRQWASDNLCAPDILEISRTIIAACGKDPYRTTRRQMDEWDIRVARNVPLHPERKLILSWHDAVRYEWSKSIKHDESEKRVWEVSTDVDAGKAREIEARLKDASTGWLDHKGAWCCSLCCGGWTSRLQLASTIKLHLKIKHSIENANVENGDLYPHPDRLHSPPISIWMLPDGTPFEDLSSEQKVAHEKGRVHYYKLHSEERVD